MVSEGHPIQFQNARRQPKVASHADFSRAGNVEKRHRIKIAALEIRSFLAKQEALDSFTNGDAANGAALTETNVTPNEIGSVKCRTSLAQIIVVESRGTLGGGGAEESRCGYVIRRVIFLERIPRRLWSAKMKIAEAHIIPNMVTN